MQPTFHYLIKKKNEENYSNSIEAILKDKYCKLYCIKLKLNYDDQKKKWEEANLILQDRIKNRLQVDSTTLNLLSQKKKIMQYVDAEYADDILRTKQELLSKMQKDNDSNLYYIFTTISIRLMISLFSFYMSQIFLKLYRYNRNVSDFYEGRYIAILAKKEFDFENEFSMKTFQHNFDFGNSPKNPFEMALELFKTVKEMKEQKNDT